MNLLPLLSAIVENSPLLSLEKKALIYWLRETKRNVRRSRTEQEYIQAVPEKAGKLLLFKRKDN